MKQLWKKSSRTLRMEQLENRELLSATTWNNAIDADAAVAAEMSEVLSAATTDAIDLSKVTTAKDVVDATDGFISLREALDYVATGQAVKPNGDLINEITFADSLNGATITLAEGELQFTNKMLTHGGEARPITIDASNLDAGVTIDAKGLSRVFNVFATENADAFTPAFKNLTIDNGAVKGDGAGIYAAGYNVTVEGCNFANNDATGNGGAIYAKQVTVKNNSTFTTVTNNSTFTDNDATGAGGAIYATSSVTATNATFTKNTATGAGGAVYGKNTTITDSTFTENKAGGAGGAVYGTAMTITGDSTFTKNVAGGHGGAVYTSGTTSINGAEFTNNTATGDGGAVYTSGTGVVKVNIEQSTFTQNAGKNGGAIYSKAFETVKNSTFTQNTATENGGAIYMNSGTIGELTEVVISKNKAARDGGGFYGYGFFQNATITKNTATSGSGGGAYLNGGFYSAASKMTWVAVQDSTISGNTAGENGGGVYFKSTNAGIVEDATITGNTAKNGGGVYGFKTITNATITGNTASVRGGGIYQNQSDSTVGKNDVMNVVLAKNTAGEGGAAYSYGTRFYNVTIVDNTAPNAAGVLSNGSLASKFYNSIILGNDSNDLAYGGAYYADGTAMQGSAYAYNVLSEYEGWKADGDYTVYKGDYTDVFANLAEGDYTLKFGSPAVDAGAANNNEYVKPKFDLAGDTRVQYGAVDLGAFESAYGALDVPTISVADPDFDADTLTYAVTVTVEKVDVNATGYAFQYKLAGANQWIDADATSKDGAITITGLAPNKSYDFRARALGDEYKEVEEGKEVTLVYASTDWSESATATTDKAQMNLPNLGAMISATATTIKVDFSKDTNAGQGDSYILLYQKVGDAGWKYEFVNRGENGFGTITWDNLDINAKYNVMAGVNASGDYISSLISNAQEFSTTKYQLAAPTIESVVVGESQAANNATVTVTVGEVDHATAYAVQYATAVVNEETGEVVYNWQDAKAQTDENGAFVVSGLNAATTYYFRAIASADANLYDSSYGAASDGYKTKQVVLGVPKYTLEALGHDSVKVTITEYDPNTSQFKLYLATTASTINSTTKVLDKGVTEYTFEGLNPNQTYYVTVMALGEGVYTNKQSAAQAVTTEREQLAAPEVKVTAKDQTTISVSWDRVANTDKYLVEYKATGDENASWLGGWCVIDNTVNDFFASKSLNWTISNLEAGTDYTVRVTALGFGDYLDSKAASGAATTTKYRLADPELVVDNMSQATSATDATITVKLTDDEHAQGYKIEYMLIGPEDASWKPITAEMDENGCITVDAKPNSTYDFRVKSIGSDTHYDTEWIYLKNVKTDFGRLDTPTVTVDSIGKTEVTLSLGAGVGKAEEYVFEYATGAADEEGKYAWTSFDDQDVVKIVPNNDGTYTVSGLAPNNTYVFRAQAKAADYYNSAWSEAEEAEIPVYELEAPNFTLTPYTNIGEDGNEDYGFTVNVTEDPQASAAGVRYYYYYRDAKGNSSPVATSTDATFQISGLEFGSQYQVFVQAITMSDDYASSTRSDDTKTTAAKVLDAPVVEIDKDATTASSITFTIGEVDNASGYAYQYSTTNDSWSDDAWITADNATITVKNLDPNKTYYIVAKALGEGRYADSGVANDVASAETAKGQLLLNADNVNVTATQTTVSVNVTVDAKYEDAYGSFLINYRVEGGDWTWKTVNNFESPVTFDVAPGQNYEVTVEAYVADLSGDYVDSNIYRVTGTAPKLAMEGVPTFTIEDVTGSAIVVSVDGVKEAVGYEVEYTTDGENWCPLIEEGGVYTVDGLDEQETVYFRAVAKGGELYSDVATEEDFEAKTIYAAADGIWFKQYNSGLSTKVYWTDNSSLETGYKVEYKAEGAEEWTTLKNVGENVEDALFKGYTPGTVYTFRVSMMIGDEVVASTEAEFASLAAPTGFNAEYNAVDGSVLLTWDAVAKGADSFRIEVSENGGAWKALKIIQDGAATSWNITNLKAGTTYEYRVRANTNKGGSSAWSETLEVVVPEAEATTDVVSEAFADFFAEEAEDDFWFEFEKAVGARK